MPWAELALACTFWYCFASLPASDATGLSSPGAASALRTPLVLPLDELDATQASAALSTAARKDSILAALPILTRP